METYYLFRMGSYYPAGGFNDLIDVFTDHREANKGFDSAVRTLGSYEWVELWAAQPGERPVKLAESD